MSSVCYLQYKEAKYTLNKDTINIGTSHNNSLIFDSEISQSAVQIKKMNAGYYLYPLVNNVFLNKKELALQKGYALKVRDIIELNNLRVAFLAEQNYEAILRREFGYLPKTCKIKRILLERKYYKVVLAENLDIQRDVIIKMLTKEAEDDIIAVNEFRRECRLAKQMSSLEHPSIAKILYVEQGMCPRFYIMETAHGMPFVDYLKKHGHMPTHQAISIVMQLVSLLKTLYEKFAILHRDLNPRNLFLSNNLVPKIYNIETMKGQTITLTAKGDIKGSVLFTAPEIYLEEAKYSVQSDIYSLGLLFLCMLKGYPFLKSMLNFSIENVDVEQPYIEEVVAKMIARSPQDRFATYEELFSALANIPQEEPKPQKEEVVEFLDTRFSQNTSKQLQSLKIGKNGVDVTSQGIAVKKTSEMDTQAITIKEIGMPDEEISDDDIPVQGIEIKRETPESKEVDLPSLLQSLVGLQTKQQDLAKYIATVFNDVCAKMQTIQEESQEIKELLEKYMSE